MKKYSLTGLAVVTLASVMLAGCGGAGASANESTNTESAVSKSTVSESAVAETEVLEGVPYDVPSNFFEDRVGRVEFNSYGEIIDLLEEGEFYGYADVMGYDDPVLFISQDVFDNGDGTLAALEVSPYTKKSNGKITADSILNSNSTSTPISVNDEGVIFCATHDSIGKYCYGNNGTDDVAIMMLASVSVDEFENGEPKSVVGFVRSKNDLVNDDIKEINPDDIEIFDEMFKEFENTHPIKFESK